jgi:hypothetical protein
MSQLCIVQDHFYHCPPPPGLEYWQFFRATNTQAPPGQQCHQDSRWLSVSDICNEGLIYVFLFHRILKYLLHHGCFCQNWRSYLQTVRVDLLLRSTLASVNTLWVSVGVIHSFLLQVHFFWKFSTLHFSSFPTTPHFSFFRNLLKEIFVSPLFTQHLEVSS